MEFAVVTHAANKPLGAICTADIFSRANTETHALTKTIAARNARGVISSNMDDSFVLEHCLNEKEQAKHLTLNDGQQLPVPLLSKNTFIWSSIMKKHAQTNNVEFRQVMNEIETLRTERFRLLATTCDASAIERLNKRLFELTDHNGYKVK